MASLNASIGDNCWRMSRVAGRPAAGGCRLAGTSSRKCLASQALSARAAHRGPVLFTLEQERRVYDVRTQDDARIEVSADYTRLTGADPENGTRRIRLHLSSAYPYQPLFCLIAKRLALECLPMVLARHRRNNGAVAKLCPNPAFSLRCPAPSPRKVRPWAFRGRQRLRNRFDAMLRLGIVKQASATIPEPAS
jgi:hypothetical protein